MEQSEKRKHNPCSFCWQNSDGKLEVESVQGFNLGSGGHWFACEDHLSEPMLEGFPIRRYNDSL